MDGRDEETVDASVRAVVGDFLDCLRFFSRLPVPAWPPERDPHAPPDFATAPRMLPLAALVIALPAALVLAAALALHLGPWLAATLAAATLVAITGALHEDGLADVADAFGGRTSARRLEIMRDSRIGSYGASALVLVFALRLGALATLSDRIGWKAGAALVAAAILSRAAALAPLALLGPARTDGAAAAVGRPTGLTHAFAWVLAAILALVTAFLGLPVHGIVLGGALAAGVGLLMTRLSQGLIGGHSGDAVGATQQLAEVATLVGILVAIPG
jgi:adenosylcobinamide-GDP ribazoletransferase